MGKIIFSVDEGILSLKDNIQAARLAEAYFNMENDKEQIPATKENIRWINKHIPECVNVIKSSRKIIGFTFIIPANQKIMNAFIERKISENTLFLEVKKKVNYENFDTIYLCSAFVKPEFRKKGLAFQAFVKSIKRIAGKREIILFFWAYTKAGEKLAKEIAKKTGLQIKKRI